MSKFFFGPNCDVPKYSNFSPRYFRSGIAQQTAPTGIAQFVTNDGTISLNEGKMICPQRPVFRNFSAYYSP